MRIFIIIFFLYQITYSQSIKHFNIQTYNTFIEKVKIIGIKKSVIILDDNSEIPLTDIISLSSFSDVNIVYPAIVGGSCGFAGGFCGLIAGSVLGFGLANEGESVGSTAAPWATLFTWDDRKQMPSLYIGMGLGFIGGYKVISNYLYKKSENNTDMHQWSNQEKYHFFNKLMYPSINTATKLNKNFNNSFKSNELVSLAENEAIKLFNSNNYQIFGAGSCLLGWIGVPASVIFIESGIRSSFDSNNYNYLKLNSEQKSIFKKSYKEKEKKLKRKSVYKTQLGCFALFSLLLMSGNVTSG